MKKTLLLSLAISAIFALNGCGGGGSSGDKGSAGPGAQQAKKNPLEIYPNNPVVASEDGQLQLAPVIKTGSGILENSDEHTLVATYKSSDPDTVLVAEDGYVLGQQPGEAKVTVTIKDLNTSKTYTNSVNVQVKTVDVSKLFLNPSAVSVGKNQSKELYLTALDREKAPTEIEGKYLSLKYAKSLISATPIITPNDAKVKITAKNEKGYTFLTPIYNKAGVEVTGDPAIVQISSIPQINIPQDLSGGDEIDFLRVKNGSGDNMYIAHTNDDDKIYVDFFNVQNGMWARKDLTYTGDSIKAPKIIYANKTINIFAIVDDSKIERLYSEDGTSWMNQEIFNSNDNSLGNVDYNNIDYVLKDDTVYMLVANGSKIYLAKYKLDSSSAQVITSFDAKNSINSVDLTLNKNGALRFVYSTSNGEVWYNTVDLVDKKIVQYKVYYTSNGIEAAKIDYTKNNIPVIVYQTSGKIVEAQLTNGGGWASNSISSTQLYENGIKNTDALDSANNFDFKVDKFGNSRIVVSADDKLYYLKEYHVKKTPYWRVDTIVNKNVGEYVSLQIDNKSRLKVAYTDSNKGWVKFFAEPVYIKYNDGKDKKRVSDNIKNPDNTINYGEVDNSSGTPGATGSSGSSKGGEATNDGTTTSTGSDTTPN